MTVKELMFELSKYPETTEIKNINQVVKSSPQSISFYYEENLQEIEDRRRRIEEANRRHREEMDRKGEITCFANRW